MQDNCLKSSRRFHIQSAIPRVLLLASVLFLAASGRTEIQLPTVASGWLFILEQDGRIRILSNNTLVITPYLNLQSKVRGGGELGLLGLAFHPEYANNGRSFVNYTRDGPTGLETVISEFSVSAPGFAGLLQINATVPPAIAPGSDVPVVVHIGSLVAQSGVTLAVQ